MASISAVRAVTGGCDASRPLPPISPLSSCGTVYKSASRWRCPRPPFGLCANLRLCDESTDSQAVPPIDGPIRVNQLRNIALERCRQRRNISTGRSVPLNAAPRPSHPQPFPQARAVSRSDFPVSVWGRRFRTYSPGSLLPSIRLAKRVELCRNARLNLPMGPFRCLAMMISARPLRSGSSCL